MFWILFTIGLPIFLYWILVKPCTYWASKGVPQFNEWTLWIRTFKGFFVLKPAAERFQELYNSFPNKRYAGIYMLFRPSLLVRDPDLIKQITVKDFDHFLDHNQIILPDRDPLWEKNLFSLKGDKWREMRTILTPSFTGSKMKAMFGLVSECAEGFVRYFQSQELPIVTVEMKDVFTRFTNDVIASTAFGVRCDSLKDRENEFYMMGKAASNFGFKFILLVAFPRFAKLLGIRLFEEKIRTFFKKLVLDSIEMREREGIVRPDLIHLLMEARKGKLKHDEKAGADATVGETLPLNKESIPEYLLSDDDMTAQAFGFFLAGFETVSASMSFAAYELAVNPDVQERLQQEIDDTLSTCNGSVTYDALMKMKYFDMVISESLRKWPPTGATDRVCNKPYTIEPKDGEKPVHLDKGNVVLIPVFGLHRDPLLYPEPDRFDPERFSDENKSAVRPYTYFPFGGGPRSCIGNRFAVMEIKLVLFHILSKFDITVVEKTTVPLQLGPNLVTLSSKDGFWLGLKARNVEP